MPEQNTFTTDFQSIDDGDTLSFTPQELVQQNALIDVVSAQAQFRGDSRVEFNTRRGDRQNSDSASASIDTLTSVAENSDTETTTGNVTVEKDLKSATNTSSGSFGGTDGSVSAQFPSDPTNFNNPRIQGEPAVQIETVSVDYYVVEDTGGSDTGIVVEFDDDPFDASNFDTRRSGISIGGNSEKQVGGFSDTSIDTLQDYAGLDGGQIRIVNGGDNFGTIGVKVEATVTFTVRTLENEIDTKQLGVKYPDTPRGATFKEHRIYLEDGDGNTVAFERETSNQSDSVKFKQTPPNVGAERTLRIETVGTNRVTRSDTASVKFPSVPSSFSFDRHEIRVEESGSVVRDDTIFANRTGETVSRTSNTPSESVSITLETYYSKTVRNVIDTANPSIEGDFLPERLNTDSVILALDTSTSANQARQQEVGRQIVNNLSQDTLASVIGFEYDATTLVSKQRVGDVRAELIDAINDLESEGGTEFIPALDQASVELDGYDGTIVLISDGRSGDDPIDRAAEIGDSGTQIVTIQIDDGSTETLEAMADVSNGVFFDGTVNADLFGTVLADNELSSFSELQNITRSEQSLTFSIEGSDRAEFRLRFTWEYLTPEARVGTVGFYNESLDVWKEAAVAIPDDTALDFNHVQVYNESIDEWGALDVVDLSNENAIEAFQFYDEDAGWLAPREYNDV